MEDLLFRPRCWLDRIILFLLRYRYNEYYPHIKQARKCGTLTRPGRRAGWGCHTSGLFLYRSWFHKRHRSLFQCLLAYRDCVRYALRSYVRLCCATERRTYDRGLGYRSCAARLRQRAGLGLLNLLKSNRSPRKGVNILIEHYCLRDLHAPIVSTIPPKV